MLPAKCACPKCGKSLKLPAAQQLPAKVKCPNCITKFMINPNGTTLLMASESAPGTVSPAIASSAQPPVMGNAIPASPIMLFAPSSPQYQSGNLPPLAPVLLASAPVPSGYTGDVRTSPQYTEAASGAARGKNLPLLITFIAAGVLLLGGGITLAAICFGGGDDKDKTNLAGDDKDDEDKDSSADANRDSGAGGKDDDGTAGADSGRKKKKVIIKPIEKKKPVEQPPPETPKVKAAIEKGVKYLQATLAGTTPSYYGYNNNTGAIALTGLTLLHCGVKKDDPAVVKAVDSVRKIAPMSVQTYELCTCLWFLDRLNDPKDKDLIKKIALQLVAAQGVNGGWNYTIKTLDEEQQKTLLSLLQKHGLNSKLDGDGNLGDNPKKPSTDKGPRPRRGGVRYNPRFNYNAFSGDLTQLPVLQYQPGQKLEWRAGQHEDNSLTQFVILALWSAQKHGVATERSLSMAEARYRACQNTNGSWTYMWTNPKFNYSGGSTIRNDSMTCAGLLGLAVGRGIKTETKLKEEKKKLKKLIDDPQVVKGMEFISLKIGQPPLTKGGKRSPGETGNLVGAATWGDLYYLWSLERVAVVYNLKKINGKDWYEWGSEILVDHQKPDGSWQEAFPGLPDTCFALLFLKRANVVQDLTTKIQKLETKLQ